MTTYDIIRHYKTGKKRLVMACVTEKQRDEWCNSPKTRTAKYFDGFTVSHRTTYKCQLGTALYPSNYSINDLK